MSTSTAPARRSTALPASPIRLTVGGILRSEWIKLRSLRSTVWAYAVVFALQVAIGLLVVSVTVSNTGETFRGGPGANIPELATLGATAGVIFGQLVVSVLGVLVISGEYSTGQIRSSFAAVPKRLPVLWAKLAVFGVTTFVVSLVSILIAFFVTYPILSNANITADLWDPNVFLKLVGAAGYLALSGMLALGIGAILRSTAGGIAAALGLLLVVPIVFGLIPADWSATISDWLPGNAGTAIYQSSRIFEWWQGLLIMLGWIAVAIAAAATLMRRRDA
ncbi:ABC transporter permease [Subtercola sp. Z020]|uniref:ABC transporter permease n=1 Tax=Subtercola sp. Z020 TaxID=2080582 RepID=UPI000CE931B1|nr:ABC transporter permease [Subtercola sp. Z020]PPF80435.1 ABC transporter permease [Subtercola sp. Z020]